MQRTPSTFAAAAVSALATAAPRAPARRASSAVRSGARFPSERRSDMFATPTLRPMNNSLRVLAALLAYPDAHLREHFGEMRALLADEGAISPSRQAELDALIDTLQRADALETEAAYVELFERGRATSLHLFEHVHGDSRDRG